MSQKYVMQSNGGGFRKGAVVTDEDLKNAGADVEFWKRNNTIRAATSDDEMVPTEGPVTDAQNKDRVEQGINKATVEKGIQSIDEQDQLAAEITGNSAEQTEKASKATAEQGRSPTMPSSGRQSATSTSEDLNDLTVAELHERAKTAGVEGYSSMHKDELVKAVRKAEKKGT